MLGQLGYSQVALLPQGFQYVYQAACLDAFAHAAFHPPF
jgi:hypothetical protein